MRTSSRLLPAAPNVRDCTSCGSQDAVSTSLIRVDCGEHQPCSWEHAAGCVLKDTALQQQQLSGQIDVALQWNVQPLLLLSVRHLFCLPLHAWRLTSAQLCMKLTCKAQASSLGVVLSWKEAMALSRNFLPDSSRSGSRGSSSPRGTLEASMSSREGRKGRGLPAWGRTCHTGLALAAGHRLEGGTRCPGIRHTGSRYAQLS